MRMKKLLFYLSAVVILAMVSVSCTEESSEETDAAKFTRIYDSKEFTESFKPVDMVETADGGFLILAEKTILTEEISRRIYLLKTDHYGNIIKELTVDEGYTNPLPGLTVINDEIFFFGMDLAGNGLLFRGDPAIESLTPTPVGLSYPAAISYQGAEGFLVLSYDQIDKKTVFSKVTTEGSVTISRNFKIADDDSFDDMIVSHFLKTGKQFPFSIGRFPGGQYYFNGFYDYNFSLILTSLQDDDDVTQYIYGQKNDGGFSAILPIGANAFAASYFNFGANYFVPSVALSSNPNSITNLTGYSMRELVPDANVTLKPVSINSTPYLAYLTDTNSKQIGLYLYEQSTGKLAGLRYFGFSNPFSGGDFTITSDGSIVICGSTKIAGRFERIVLIKLTREEVDELVK